MTLDDTRLHFRNAMASLPAAVNVITTDGPQGRCGITASAVCSVTDTPPTMLVCVNQASYVHDVLHGNRRVCINVLGAHSQELARVFAGMTGCSMAERFEQCAWQPGRLSVPVLDDAIASLEGTVCESKSVGSHSVIFVRVEHIGLRDEGDGLIYFGRQFHRLARAAASCAAG
ncbi:MAG TPA: 4-hydroxyphenylacetate 3-monooxygenase, reductase component [Paraburkholderia sp.]